MNKTKKEVYLRDYWRGRNFCKAVNLILYHEGGYANDPSDPGGETKFGISKRAYPALSIKDLSENEAKAIYKRDYWDVCRCDKLPYPIAVLLFDTAVNMGVATAIKLLQRAALVTDDGIVGPQTIAKVNSFDEVSLATTFCALRIKRYTALSTYKRYGTGWIRRVFETAIVGFRLKGMNTGKGEHKQ